MVNVNDIVDKYKRRYSPDEWQNGVNNYVNDPDFDSKFSDQKQKAHQKYVEAGAPADWAARQQLGLSLVSPDDFKTAITSKNALTAYTNGKDKGVAKLQRMAYYPAEQANAIQDIISNKNISNNKARMDVAYCVGQHFKKAVDLKLTGDTTGSDNELQQAVIDMNTYGVGNFYDDTNKKLTDDGTDVLNILKTHRDQAATGVMQG